RDEQREAASRGQLDTDVAEVQRDLARSRGSRAGAVRDVDERAVGVLETEDPDPLARLVAGRADRDLRRDPARRDEPAGLHRGVQAQRVPALRDGALVTGPEAATGH